MLGHYADLLPGGREVKRRVVITGMGTVSPNGVGNAAFSAAVLKGKSGIRRITRSILPKFRCRSQAKLRTSTNWPGWKNANANTFAGAAAGACRRDRSLAHGGNRRRFPSPGRETALRRDHGIGRRIAGVHRRTVPIVLPSAIQADESVLRAHGRHGRACRANSACASGCAAPATS